MVVVLNTAAKWRKSVEVVQRAVLNEHRTSIQETAVRVQCETRIYQLKQIQGERKITSWLHYFCKFTADGNVFVTMETRL